MGGLQQYLLGCLVLDAGGKSTLVKSVDAWDQ